MNMTNNDEINSTQHSSRTLLANEDTINLPSSIEVNYITISVSEQPISQLPAETVSPENEELDFLFANQLMVIIVVVTGAILIVVFFAVYLRRNIIKFKKYERIEEYVSRYVQKFNAKDIYIMRDPTGGYHGTYEKNLATGSDGENSSTSSDSYSTVEIEFEDPLFWKATASIDYIVNIDQDNDFANGIGLPGQDDDYSSIDSMNYII
jgi:hypothetical protein